MDINKILKILFILSATVFLITMVSVPKTHCDACEIDYEQTVVDGIEAWEIFEDACISYEKPYNTYYGINDTFNISLNDVLVEVNE